MTFLCAAPLLAAPATVTFVNRADGYRNIDWIDFNGVPQNYAALDPGQSYVVDTSVGHPWLITDGPGNCVELYEPAPGESTYDLTAPAPMLGPE